MSMRARRIVLAALAIAMLGGCGRQGGASAVSLGSGASSAPSAAPVSAAPEHQWASQEGDLYGYIAAQTEEDKKAGIGSSAVIMFRYLGARDGVHYLETGGVGNRTVYACANPCKIVKSTTWDVTGESSDRRTFDPDSIIGAALTDAFNGQLRASSETGVQFPITLDTVAPHAAPAVASPSAAASSAASAPFSAASDNRVN
jgi:hypothetical protein